MKNQRTLNPYQNQTIFHGEKCEVLHGELAINIFTLKDSYTCSLNLSYPTKNATNY